MSHLWVAAIIPVYNRPKLVIEAIESVHAQTQPPHLLIVVDDGSTDDTADRVQAWFDAHETPYQKMLIRQENKGASAARNAAAQVSRRLGCELLAFLDSDDLWPPDFLAEGTRVLTTSFDAVAASADRKEIPLGATSDKGAKLIRFDLGDHRSTLHFLLNGTPGTPNTIIRASVFHAIGGYDVNQLCGEDYQLMLRLSLRGRWCYIPSKPVIVRRQPNAGDDGNGAAQLSKTFKDRRFRLAQMMDNFLLDEAGARDLPEPPWRKRLGNLWYAAGRDLLALGRKAEAKQCFQRAVGLLPWHLRARWRSMTTKPD